jgi:hypothetical protein
MRHDWREMSKSPSHQPPPPTIVDALVRAGVTPTTALAMERWKAEEVLELLRQHGRTDAPRGFLPQAR